MRRYGEMEADYTRKSQANAGAVQAVNALAPIFDDPEISRSLQEMQFHPLRAIQEWAMVHKRAVHPDPRERLSLIYDMAQRMGFDPARLFAVGRNAGPPGSQPEIKDPAVKYLADQYGRTASDLQALRNELQNIRAQEQQKHQQEAFQQVRWSIDNYAEEKGPDGKPLRPHFDKVIDAVIELFKADPERDLNEAYERACWMDPEVRKLMLDNERNKVTSQQAAQRAQAAVRGNTRGLTSPVAKPSAKPKNGSLRDTLEASADEVGFS